MKRLKLWRNGLQVVGLLCLAVSLPASWAHPDAVMGGKLGAAAPGSEGLNPAQPAQSNPKKKWFHDQRKAGYVGHVRSIVVQAAHAHWKGESGLDPLPVEIWYVATSKVVGGSTVYYCVAPRIENPATGVWNVPLDVRLFEVGAALPLASTRLDPPIESGASRELRTSMEWCVKRPKGEPVPRLIFDTDHGAAYVAFPAPP